ncbi:MAG: type I-C CRISPR-associated protein Cas8c/Csd1 [Firmicutes bacterium]|nr:type I-C CRISPR-associated protein Cas8c/Csd1 [Bacillota bacterium]
MIINTLYQYYEKLRAEYEDLVPKPGYSQERISLALILSPNGELLKTIDLRTAEGKRLLPKIIVVPERQKRSRNISANFLWDNATYVLGLDTKGNPEHTQQCFKAFVKLHTTLLEGNQDMGAKAVLAFLQNWDPTEAAQHPLVEPFYEDFEAGVNLTFRLDEDRGYIHQRPTLQKVWEHHHKSKVSDYIGQCLVTGKTAPVARLHPLIKGVVGTKGSGAAMVSFNLDAFTSYGKSQNYNAPIKEEVAFGYTTALNYLLKSPKHRLQIGNTTTIFWAERPDGQEESLLAELLDPSIGGNSRASEYRRDPATRQQVHDLLKRVRRGQPIQPAMSEVKEDVRFYILGLSPNASRLSVRFWHTDTFGQLVGKIGQHYRDSYLIPMWPKDPPFIAPWQILRETAPQKSSSDIPPLLGGALMRSILQGFNYPLSLYSILLSRIRADGEVNYVRVAALKACLLRQARFRDDKKREVMITVSLNEDSTNTPYRLGRLFALLEKAQQDANPGIGATIRDRYFGAASANPGRVFPILLRLAQHHIAKSDYKIALDKSIQEVVSRVTGFPANLNLEEQGLFVLGYYHQRKALYQKKSNDKEVLDDDSH